MILNLVNRLVCIHKIDYRFDLKQLRDVIDRLLTGEEEEMAKVKKELIARRLEEEAILAREAKEEAKEKELAREAKKEKELKDKMAKLEIKEKEKAKL